MKRMNNERKRETEKKINLYFFSIADCAQKDGNIEVRVSIVINRQFITLPPRCPRPQQHETTNRMRILLLIIENCEPPTDLIMEIYLIGASMICLKAVD